MRSEFHWATGSVRLHPPVATCVRIVPHDCRDGASDLPRTITIGNYAFAVEPGAHRRFWERVARGDWEPETFVIFDRFIREDTLFVDIGAWIGSTALYGVQRADLCIAFEPDPVAFAELEINVAVNAGEEWTKRLKINECAINKDGTPFTLGGSAEGADSMSSALFPNRDSQWTVRAKRLHDVLSIHRKPGQPVFIKIDIEGGEYDLLPAISDVMADPLVTTYISFHPNMLRRSTLLSKPPDKAHEEFVNQHLAAIQSLPWARSIVSGDGMEIDRTVLEDKFIRRARFPRVMLVSGP